LPFFIISGKAALLKLHSRGR